MPTNRQYTCIKYHLLSAIKYSDLEESRDWEKVLSHLHAAELILTLDIQDYKQYVKWCISNRITKYDWTKEVTKRNG